MESTLPPKTAKEELFDRLKENFEDLNKYEKTRELSLAITNLEQAMMWFNKYRTISGELGAYPTHV